MVTGRSQSIGEVENDRRAEIIKQVHEEVEEMSSISQVEIEAVDNRALLPGRMGKKMNKKKKHCLQVWGRKLNEVSSDGFNTPLLSNQRSSAEIWRREEDV